VYTDSGLLTVMTLQLNECTTWFMVSSTNVPSCFSQLSECTMLVHSQFNENATWFMVSSTKILSWFMQ
jgi:hypothetical protein